jgi:hypothetical protein
MRNRHGPLRAEPALAGPLALSLNRPANTVRANRAIGKVSTNDGEGILITSPDLRQIGLICILRLVCSRCLLPTHFG